MKSDEEYLKIKNNKNNNKKTIITNKQTIIKTKQSYATINHYGTNRNIKLVFGASPEYINP